MPARACAFCDGEIGRDDICGACGRSRALARVICGACGQFTPTSEAACSHCGASRGSEMAGKIVLIVVMFVVAFAVSVTVGSWLR